MPYNGFSNYCLEWYPRTQGESHRLVVNIKCTSHLHLRISSASLAVPPPTQKHLSARPILLVNFNHLNPSLSFILITDEWVATSVTL